MNDDIFRYMFKKEPQKMNDSEVKELVVLAKSGNQEAFEKIYSLFYLPVYRFIFLQVKHRQDAEDLAQTTFFKALQSLGGFEERGAKFSTWVYTIARNSVIDHWKKKKDIITSEVDFIENVASGENPEDRIYKGENANMIKSLIEELSQEQKEIMILYFVEELSYKEISTIIGKKEDAIRALKYRALKSLRDKIEGLQHKYEF